MSADRHLVFQGGKWLKTHKPEAGEAVRFRDVRWYHANLIGYARVAMCLTAAFTMSLNQPLATACLLLGATLLDWVDGPVARAYNQCSIFGSGIDWLADLLAQVVTMLWWGILAPAVVPWLVIATAIELATGIFDFGTTAKEKYPVPGPQRGFFIILQWSMPGGCYTPFGTLLWLAYPVFALACCLHLSWPVRSELTNALLRISQGLSCVPALLYLWCELAYLLFIVGNWTEAPRKPPTGKGIHPDNDALPGVENLGTVAESEQ
jgi:phosphatidylglycerophosphate synthase